MGSIRGRSVRGWVWWVGSLGLACGGDGDASDSSPTSGDSVATSEVMDDSTESVSMSGASGGQESTGGDPTGADSTGSDDSGDSLNGSCPGVTLEPRPLDTAERGPWAVGAKTVDLDGLTVEVWYPAVDPGPAAEPAVYDIREALPLSEREKISDEDNPWQMCDCVRDLPIDDAHGPYPVVLFVHGTAGFRSQSLPQMVHWASRGFVVMAADHPGLWLADILGIACGAGMVPQNLQANLATMLAAVRGEIGGLEDFGDRIDPDRIATAGHSAGGNAVAATGASAQVVIPMAAGGVEPGAVLESSLILGAMSDSVVIFSRQVDGYTSSPARKRLVGISNTGHLAFSQMCALKNAAEDSLLEIAQAAGVCGAGFAGALFQCDDSFVPDTESWDIINFASSAVLEETLHCEPQATSNLGLIQGTYPVVLEFREEL